jgi:ABC-type transport system involved in multi-copper enzyme maturation permease subunit
MSRILVITNTVWKELLRRKDMYVMLIMLAALLYALLSVDIFGLGTTARYIMDLGLLMAWLFILIMTVNVSCRQLPDEERKGTIYPLLAKPITRGELLLGKWMGSWSVVSCATAVFYLLVAVVVKAYGGSFEWHTLAQGWVVHVAGLAAIAAMGTAFSTRLTYGAAASMSYVVVGSSLLMLPRVPEMLVAAGGARATTLLAMYYLLPHFELFDMRMRIVHERGTIPWISFIIVLAYGMALTALLLFISWLGYRRKHFERGAML